MTDDEMRRQKADLMLECHEAELKVANLQEKATRIAALIEEFGLMLRRQPSGQLYRSSQAHHGFQDAQPTHQRHIDAMNVEQAFLLADEIREARANLDRLLDRKKKLGLP